MYENQCTHLSRNSVVYYMYVKYIFRSLYNMLLSDIYILLLLQEASNKDLYLLSLILRI